MENLCNTCLLFGSPFAAARINVSDLYISDQKWLGGIQVRDGVAIDRDSERAKDRLKYDFEVIPVGAKFTLSLVLENATPQDLQIISVGLSEFVHGFGVIGGKRSRGLGVCELQDLTVSSLELVGPGYTDIPERNKRLQAYLVHKKFSTENEPGEQFLEKHINKLSLKLIGKHWSSSHVKKNHERSLFHSTYYDNWTITHKIRSRQY